MTYPAELMGETELCPTCEGVADIELADGSWMACPQCGGYGLIPSSHSDITTPK